MSARCNQEEQLRQEIGGKKNTSEGNMIEARLAQMSAPSLENGGDWLQERQTEAKQRHRCLRQAICVCLLKKISKLPRQNGQQDYVDEKHHEVKQDAAVCMCKELLEHSDF